MLKLESFSHCNRDISSLFNLVTPDAWASDKDAALQWSPDVQSSWSSLVEYPTNRMSHTSLGVNLLVHILPASVYSQVQNPSCASETLHCSKSHAQHCAAKSSPRTWKRTLHGAHQRSAAQYRKSDSTKTLQKPTMDPNYSVIQRVMTIKLSMSTGTIWISVSF